MAFWKKDRDPNATIHPDEKKPGMFRRLWRRIRGIDWKNPVNRWKLFFFCLAVFVFGISFVGGAIAFTNSPSFCKACHEMSAEYVTFEQSSHSQQTCVSCHIAPGNVEMVLHKMESLKEVYYHIVGPPDPIVQTVAVLDENCLTCHSDKREITPNGDLIVAHQKHVDEEIPCITCHSGVAHAKVVERNINDSSTYDDWTKANAKKLMGDQYMRPNMGTCVDCHEQVNQGKKPWKDIAYSLPENPHKEGKGKKEEAKKTSEDKAVTDKEGKSSHQQAVLKTVNSQMKDVKLSMECGTCHTSVTTPTNHANVDWSQNHGEAALAELDKCMDCHKDSKWIKVLAKQDIKQLLKDGNKEQSYTPNITVVKNEARGNEFCNTCHENRPASHVDSYTWLTNGHAFNAETNEAKARCFVCHDRDKTEQSTTSEKTKNDVYCQYCHRTGFKDENL